MAVYANRTNDLGTPSTIPPSASFDESTPLATALTTVTEPALSLDKSVTDDAGNDDIRPTQPGDSYTYTVSVTNNGSSPAYDVEVSDQPDAELENVVLTTGSAFVTSDGWTAGDPDIHWVVPGPIAPGATVIMRYTADLVGSLGLSQGQLVLNTADVDRYWGVSQAERTANGHDTASTPPSRRHGHARGGSASAHGDEGPRARRATEQRERRGRAGLPWRVV